MSARPNIITFGCRLNAFESEVMRGHAQAAGLTDAVIVNTCAVTAEAERQARQAIRKARRENPDARIVQVEHTYTRDFERDWVDADPQFRSMLRTAARLVDEVIAVS